MPSVDAILVSAIGHFRGGNPRQAEELLRELVLADPGCADAHHLLGVIAIQTNRFDQAVKSIGQALAVKPNAPDYHVNLGLALESLGRSEEAVAHFQQALRILPSFPEAHLCLGNVRLRQGNPTEAMACFREAVRARPGWAEPRNGLGLALVQLNRLNEASQYYGEALRLKPDLAESHYNLGNCLKRQEKFEDAIRCYREALRFKPNLPEACNNLAGVLSSLGQLEEAISWYRQALRIRPQFADAFNGLGHAYERQQLVDPAIMNYREALRLNPGCAEAHNGLGCALEKKNELDEAVACFRQALRLDPLFAEAHNNLGTALERQEKLDDALANYEQAMQLRSGYMAARWNRARLWLLQGDFEKGWPEYEGRWTQTDHVRRHTEKPLWDGSALDERTILLHAEQGLGDTLQFIRYAGLVKRCGGRVVVECQPALLPLLASATGIDLLIGEGSPLPAFEVQAPLGSLPGIFRTTLDTIPARIPYLHAEKALLDQWKPKLEALRQDGTRPTLLVGIAWQGNPKYGLDRQRSIPLALFASLAEIEGVRLISLQKGPGQEQATEIPFALSVFSIDESSGVFMDTAAIMKNLDLVISSDTAVPHLAGALGVPVWLMLAKIPDWRWLLKRQDCPWYPTMRLIRQKKDGDWIGVFQELTNALKNEFGQGNRRRQ